jgi:hypothetical protein
MLPRGVESDVTGVCQYAAMSLQTPPGWYPDGQGSERYWDGTGWTEGIRPPVSPDAPVAGAAPKKDGAFSKLGAAVKKAAADRQSAKEEVARQQAEYAHAAGSLVTSGVFGTSTIEIYEGGYARIAVGREDSPQPATIAKSTPYEKLRSIKFVPSDEDKASAAPSQLEGAVGAAMTSLFKGGKTLMKGTVPGLAAAGVAHIATTGSRRAFLTVATDKAIHTLSNQSSNSFGVKTSNKAHYEVARALEVAGNAVLGLADASAPPHSLAPEANAATHSPAAPTLADRLRELAGLHAEGILSDEEYATGKAKLLGGL